MYNVQLKGGSMRPIEANILYIWAPAQIYKILTSDI